MTIKKPRIYHIEERVLLKEVAEEIDIPLKGINLSKPLLQPFVSSGSDLDTTLIIDSM